MSRWLKSAVNILDKLDDRVETVAEDASNILVDADGAPNSNLTGLTNRFLGQAQSDSDDGSYYDDEEEDEEDYYDDDEEDGEAEGAQDEVVEPSAVVEPDTSFDTTNTEASTGAKEANSAPPLPVEVDRYVQPAQSPPTKAETQESGPDPPTPAPAAPLKQEIHVEEIQTSSPPVQGKPVSGPKSTQKVQAETQQQSRTVKAPPSSGQRKIQPTSAPRSNNTSSSAHGGRSAAELQKAQQEIQRLSKQNASLQTQLEAAQSELNAQNSELEQAAERMAEDRQLADEERDELLDEHEDALRNLKASYEARLKDQQDKFQQQLEDLRQQLATEARMRAKEGGDMTEELGDAIERERQALEKADRIQKEKSELEQTNEKLEMQGDALRDDVKRLSEAAQTSADRERQAEERLDAANTAHQRALNNRQAREQELEHTITKLNAALAQKGSGPKANSLSDSTSAFVPSPAGDLVEQSKYNMAVEELESTKAQLELAAGRCEALQNELQILSRERTEEVSRFQEKERGHDETLERYSAKIARLEASLREYKALNDDSASGSSATPEGKAPPGSSSSTDPAMVRQLTRDLDKSKRQIASLSDQLLRQQGLTESAKSEVLALRGRLQSATSRAEAAEQANLEAEGSKSMLHVESGSAAYGGGAAAARRKRVKMGGRGGGGRTMRSALGLHAMDNTHLEQVAQTVDGLDLFMLETGMILRGEPLARLGLLIYMLILHLWCFGLVFFHAVESEHGDLGTLTARRHVLDVGQHPLP